MIEPTSHRFVSQRLSLSYLDWGNADKPLLILVHGGEDHARSWDRVALRLRDDWHVVCVDLRGHGDSDWSPDVAYAIEYHACDLAALVTHLGSGDVRLLAHSFGGAVALRYAGLYPERIRRIAAIEGLAGVQEFAAIADNSAEQWRGEWREWMDRRLAIGIGREHRRFASVADAAERVRRKNPGFPSDLVDHLTRHGLRVLADGSHIWKFDTNLRPALPANPSDPYRAAIWGAIECPVLLIHGADSWARNPADDGRAAMFADARVLSIAGAGHWVHHDRLDIVVAALRNFL